MVIKYLLYALLVLFLMGCSRVVDYDHVNSVNVLARDSGRELRMTDKRQITQLLKSFNSSRKELFLIFRAEYVIYISYENGETKKILFGGNCFKIDGVSYSSSEDLSKMVEAYFE
ncbi:MAG: hypothetical protein J5767_06125 [Paludibacteraceae bacterium]|nr:hypothetical protein [Paludibacteraceae bacterium]